MSNRYRYLIVGGGMTAAAAITGIREVDRDGSIGVITSEPHPPYNRPPLSKALWKGTPLASIWRTANDAAVTFHQGATAREMDVLNKRVTDDHGIVYDFEKLLLATGCRPRTLSFGEDQIIYFRTVDDYQRLRALAEHGNRFAVIGGGFIGSEIAAALAMNGKKVTLIFRDEFVGSRIYPVELARSLSAFYRERGVEVIAGATVTSCESHLGKPVLNVRDIQTGTEREIIADGIVAGIGVQPNVELAQAAGLTVDNGIRVDASLRTSSPDIYAAGDVASIYNPSLDQWRRVEHEDSANSMGGHAGVAMAGRMVSYDHLPFFYSDIFEMGYEAVGEVDSRLEMVTDWKIPCKEGVVYYLRDGRVRGVLIWNIYGLVDGAKRLIAGTTVAQLADPGRRLPT
jgi:3-phenylpropionate/trans-cinnamate dioxygenase ferredoxin reductase component